MLFYRNALGYTFKMCSGALIFKKGAYGYTINPDFARGCTHIKSAILEREDTKNVSYIRD